MNLNLTAIRSAVVEPEQERALSYEELVILAQAVLLSEPHGYFVDRQRYARWSYQGLLEYVVPDLYMNGLLQGVDIALRLVEASYYREFHRAEEGGLVLLTPPEDINTLLQLDIYQPRHDALLARLRQTPLQASYPATRGITTPESVAEMVRTNLYLSPDERTMFKWMAGAYDSPVMPLMTRFGYMDAGNRRLITDIIVTPSLADQLTHKDRTIKRFLALVEQSELSAEERHALVFIGRSEYLADLGRRVIRLPQDRREMLYQML